MTEMRRGSIALIDALGFKGLWRRCAPGSSIQKLRGMRDSALSLRDMETSTQCTPAVTQFGSYPIP